MGQVVITPAIAGDVLTASYLNNNYNAITNQVNGNLDDTNLKDGGVTSSKIAASAVTTAKINNDAVTTLKINDEAVTTAKIADNAVSGAKIAMGSDAQGDVLFYGGTDYERLAANANNEVLQSMGGSADPIWRGQSIKGWVQFKGATGNITGSFNVSSVTRNAVGDYTISWNTNFANGSYCIAGAATAVGLGNGATVTIKEGTTPAAGSVTVGVHQFDGGKVDVTDVCVMAIGAQ